MTVEKEEGLIRGAGSLNANLSVENSILYGLRLGFGIGTSELDSGGCAASAASFAIGVLLQCLSPHRCWIVAHAACLDSWITTPKY